MVGWIRLLVFRALFLAQPLYSPVNACSPAQGPGPSSEGHKVQDNPSWRVWGLGKITALKRTPHSWQLSFKGNNFKIKF